MFLMPLHQPFNGVFRPPQPLNHRFNGVQSRLCPSVFLLYLPHILSHLPHLLLRLPAFLRELLVHLLLPRRLEIVQHLLRLFAPLSLFVQHLPRRC